MIEVLTISGHSDYVGGVSFSSDGARIITASHDETARIWDASTATELCRLTGHTNVVLSASFSKDGAYVVTSSCDTTARISDATTGDLVHELKGQAGYVWDAKFSPDNCYIITAHEHEVAIIWNVSTGTEILRLRGHTHKVISCSFAPDGKRALTCSDDGTAKIWNVSTGLEIVRFVGHLKGVCASVFALDASRIVTLSYDGTVKIWDAATGNELHQLDATDICCVDVAPDGEHVITMDHHEVFKIWNATTAQQVQTLEIPEPNGTIDIVSFVPDGNHIVTTNDNNNTVTVWRIDTDLVFHPKVIDQQTPITFESINSSEQQQRFQLYSFYFSVLFKATQHFVFKCYVELGDQMMSEIRQEVANIATIMRQNIMTQQAEIRKKTDLFLRLTKLIDCIICFTPGETKQLCLACLNVICEGCCLNMETTDCPYCRQKNAFESKT